MSGDINPTEIKMNREERCLSISFDNGKTAVLSYEFLRVYSPSAEVRGHFAFTGCTPDRESKRNAYRHQDRGSLRRPTLI